MSRHWARRIAIAALAAGLVFAAGGQTAVQAQNAAKGKAAVPEPAPPPAPPEPLPPPYEPQLMRLAEILGTLAYLRDLCGEADSAEWNGKMKALLDAEAKTDARRERLAGAYNRGFRGYEVIYRSCTPAAQTIIARFLDEGGRIAREISSRYSG